MPFEITDPAGVPGHVVRGFRVRITNTGAKDYACLAKLEEMTRSDGSPFENAFLLVDLGSEHYGM
ncbi:MAG: hypothetical protein MN733_11685 [Nitrososphaera sp.]|nr:hypothetical protein [Nitrososphaera sp.]